MAKLRCIDHGTRVIAFDEKVFHRTNGESCNGPLGLEIGGKPIPIIRSRQKLSDPYDFGDGLNFPHECTHIDCGFTCWHKKSPDSL